MTKTARRQPEAVTAAEADRDEAVLPAATPPAEPVAAAEAGPITPDGRKPGRYEAEGLRAMNEIEALPHEPARSFCACPNPEDPNGFDYHLWVWQRGANAWRRAGSESYSVKSATEALAGYVEHADVTLTTEFIPIFSVDRDALDDLVSEGRALVCPEGWPGLPGEWTSVPLDRDGRGERLSRSLRFPKVGLRQWFLDEAARAMDDRRGERTLMVRHGRAARAVVDKAAWSVGRPDLVGRQIDEELARSAQDKADAERAWREDGVRLADLPAYRARRQALGTW